MSFKFLDIKKTDPKGDEHFIFDANVWIYYCNQVRQKSYHKYYTNFLNRILKVNDEPVVYLPAAVLSEVLNRMLKDEYFPQFLASEKGKNAINNNPEIPGDKYFKKLYRAGVQYYQDREAILTSIFSYSPKVEPISDVFNNYKLPDLIAAHTDLDFGDWLIYEAAKELNAVIVSDDGDFVVENQYVITNNPNLLSFK